MLVLPHSHFLFLDSVSIHERRMLPRLLPMCSCLFTSLGVLAGTSARKCDPSIPREMCFTVTEKGTNSIASRLIMSKQSESFAPKITSSLWFLPAVFSQIFTFLSDQKYFFCALKCRRYKRLIFFFLFPASLFNLLKFPTRPSVEIRRPESQGDTLSGEFLLDLGDMSISERVCRKHLGRGGPVIGRTSDPSHSKSSFFYWQLTELGTGQGFLLVPVGRLKTHHTPMANGDAAQCLIDLLTKPVGVEKKPWVPFFAFPFMRKCCQTSCLSRRPASFLSKDAFRSWNTLFGWKQVRCKVFYMDRQECIFEISAVQLLCKVAHIGSDKCLIREPSNGAGARAAWVTAAETDLL